MSKLRKINVKTWLPIVAGGYLLLFTFYAQAGGTPATYMRLLTDTIPSSPKTAVPGNADSTRKADTTGRKDSTLHIDSLRISKDSLDAPVKYSAEDSGVLIMETGDFYLYGKSKVDYKNLKVDAQIISFNQKSQTLKAYGALDSTGNPLSKPKFVQDDMETVSDSIFFNLETGKGLVKGTFLKQGEMFVYAERLKKVNAEEAFAWRARITTCNLDTPHFAFRTRKLKVINNKLGVSGSAYPEFEGVPMPIGIPFGIYPLYQGRHSGILAPAFTSSEDFGLGIEGLGYYKVINDYVDVTTKVNLYSYGGWLLNANSKYIQRYKFTGSLNITLQNSKTLNRFGASKEEFSKSRSFMINWTHSRDSRARPGTNFSASVNFGSTKFNESLLNNPYQNYQNQLSSSISYSKDWNGKYNISINANHNQNNNLRLVNLNLPTVNFNVVTFYPFQKEEQIGTGKWYEKIGIGYSGNIQNQLAFYDTAFNFRRLLDTIQWGARHSIPISLQLPSLGPLTLTPGISYEERWYGQSMFAKWNTTTKRIDTTISKGFYTARQAAFSLAANTRIFGTYLFGPKSNIVGIRHEVRPTISFNYTPDMAASYYYDLQVDTTGRKVRASRYQGSLNGSFSEGAFGGVSFGIDNLLEMKVKNKKDTSEPDRKVKLLDGFGFTSSYNFLKDSMRLGTFNLYARSTLFDKINITATALLEPYDTDSMGFAINKLIFDPTKFKFGRLSSGNIAVTTSFQSKTKDGKEAKDKQLPVDPFMTPDEQQRQLQFARANPAEFTDFDIPWSISFTYSLNFTRAVKADYSGFETRTFSTLNFNGDFSLTDKWKVGATGYYDVSGTGLQQLSMFITREMHCWQLSINVTPIGRYRSFSILINPKSGILRDLRINRSRTFSNY
ncbi:putative LPS assembly protein LptD [Sediminibacterium ginsengisoli]|uniref:LPS-assembly protein LptD central domain-containing protein n=1 Tax=Sediminibacterium ginsengisoli TaxID=413434 RepID=A0A1T4P649_9BACT|nr:putative LPS assembly protein LptD [Sediminibacterium ginsengisoli]SJZ86871.1 hypothetical protein SAMN04488132_105167 [Sediminibacterium ginsengisoli]